MFFRSFFARSICLFLIYRWYSIIFLEYVTITFCLRSAFDFTFLVLPFFNFFSSYNPKSIALLASIILYALSVYRERFVLSVLSKVFNCLIVIGASVDRRR